MEAPGTNLTGMTDFYPLSYLFAFMQRLLPDVKTVGIIYNSGEQNSVVQADRAAAELTARNLAYVRMSVTGTADVAQVAEALAGRVDVIYSPTCNTIAAAMPIVSEAAAAQGIAVLAADVGSVRSGALATEGIDYRQLGIQTGIMAAQILRGEAQPQTMPVQSQDPANTGVFINKAMADRLQIVIPEDIYEKATFVE
jgi:putative ABC transport system substrate-binding protein